MNINTLVIDYIKRNATERSKAITGRKIGSEFGISDVGVRKIVNQARIDGITICSNSHGYFYSTRDCDINETLNQLNSRIEKVQSAISGLCGVMQECKALKG